MVHRTPAEEELGSETGVSLPEQTLKTPVEEMSSQSLSQLSNKFPQTVI